MASAERTLRPTLSPELVAEPSSVTRHLPRGTRSSNRWVEALYRTLRSPMGLVGGIILCLLILGALFANVISPHDPTAQQPGQELLGPNGQYLMGTDQLGRDVLSRVIYGSRNSLIVGVLAVLMGAGTGTFSGLLAGFFGGWVDRVIMRVTTR